MVDYKLKFLHAHMNAAKVYAQCSYAERLKVGCLFVKNNKPLSVGYNGTPSGEDNRCEDEHGNTKPNVVHAEINALKGFRHINDTTPDCDVFLTHSPCRNCALELIESKIRSLFYETEYRSQDGIKELTKAGIEVFELFEDSVLKWILDVPTQTIHQIDVTSRFKR